MLLGIGPIGSYPNVATEHCTAPPALFTLTQWRRDGIGSSGVTVTEGFVGELTGASRRRLPGKSACARRLLRVQRLQGRGANVLGLLCIYLYIDILKSIQAWSHMFI